VVNREVVYDENAQYPLYILRVTTGVETYLRILGVVLVLDWLVIEDRLRLNEVARGLVFWPFRNRLCRESRRFRGQGLSRSLAVSQTRLAQNHNLGAPTVMRNWVVSIPEALFPFMMARSMSDKR
jgi:hypothetical protein